jgi:hypothetical protein
MKGHAVEALVVNTVRRGPGQMTGMGDATDLLNIVSAGGYNDLLNELNTLDTALKVSIAASAIAAGVFLWSILGDKR